ncbi:MAG: TadE/TadG family type IV pilus assembly protein [Pseudomonadota bacterium]
MSRRERDRPWSLRRLAFWRKDEDGAATVEFVILFPVFMALFLSAFELGLYMTRQVMIDRATDLTVRAVRLGQFQDVDNADDEQVAQLQELLRYNICRRSAVVPDCANKLLIEMTTIPTDTWQTLPDKAKCEDREEKAEPATDFEFKDGQPNDLMMIRVCALLNPVFPTTRLGLKMPEFSGFEGFYALVSTSAFVIEPDGE